MKLKNELFTTNYGIYYDKWVKVPAEARINGFFNTYKRGDFTINVTSAEFYLLLKIKDKNEKTVFFDRIRTIPEYKKVRKKLGWT